MSVDKAEDAMGSRLKATRAVGLAQLAAFVPSAGRAYSAKRNFDFGPGRHVHVSSLSPYIRHRLISEQEVATAVLRAHTMAAAEKFVQEVCWRTYWKGWLEHHPAVWDAYCSEVSHQRDVLREDSAFAALVAAAERGDTGIECFDTWARELIETGYLHNHARMWFASIWIFTLGLPWALGAEFFYLHLLDGDPASNTLSWRWVAGLHTRGKTYLARADNIASYTDGRFQPGRDELASVAIPLSETAERPRGLLPIGATLPHGTQALLLLTEEDLSAETLPALGKPHAIGISGVAIMEPDAEDGPRFSAVVRAFKTEARHDAKLRAHGIYGQLPVSVSTADALIALAYEHSASCIITSLMPVGPTREALVPWRVACAEQDLPLHQIVRPWDQLFWPHATSGFFKLKERIPRVLLELGIPAK